MDAMRSTHKRPRTRLARTGVWLYTTAACFTIVTLAYIFCMLRQTGDLREYHEDDHDDGFHDWTEQDAAQLAAYHAVSKHQLLIASHNRLFWYNTETENVTVLHEGQGVHYGIFPGSWDSDGRRLRSVWNVVRPHNWHPSCSEEFLLELDADTGEELQRVRLDARFTHDAVRRGDRVYVASTEAGSVLELAYPGMAPLRNISLYQRQQHINTLAPLSNTTLWAVLHNLGESAIVKLDTTPSRRPREMMRYPGVGHSAHGLVLYQQYFLLLDSQAARLVALDIVTGDITELWKAPDEGRFLKGLAVVDDVAYFGITQWAERQVRDSPSNDCELAAYDLATSSLMWRRKVPSHGLLNIIAAPHLGEQSSYAAVYSSAGGHLVLHDSDAMVEAFEHYVHSSQYPAMLGGQWASGRPFLNAEAKQTDTPWDAGLALPLVALDVSELKARVASAPEAMWDPQEQRHSNALIDGRQDNMVRFKPGVQAMMLLFSDQAGRRVFKFPYWDYFAAQMEPLLEEILGRADLRKLIRVQLARMPPGSTILTHQDMGGYAKEGHRIHIPLITHEAVSFQTCPQDILERCPEDEDVQQWARDNAGRAATDPDAVIDLMPCVEIPAPEGMVFELNNRVPHRVLNHGDMARVHLVVDVAESPRVPRVLPPGTVCEYESGRTMCPGAVAEGGSGGRAAGAARVAGSHVDQ